MASRRGSKDPCGFFRGRSPLELEDGGDQGRRYARYVNVPGLIAVVVSSKLATLYELQTIYGLQDAYDLLEIIRVDGHNARVSNADDN
ncbi:MAG: hypothetical protein EBR82_11270 [Caulobacteraceae bacterium]|nr:hypothetical protein [Caulobacteraceae bacterium]